LVKKTLSTTAVLSVGAGAGVEQARNHPYEWGGGAAGFGRRVTSVFGKRLVKHAIQIGVAGVRHEELSYDRSGETAFGPRIRHALIRTVVARKTTTGQNTIATGRISGAFGSSFVSRLWMPVRFRTVSSAASSGAISLGVDAGVNVVREFWPEIRHPRRDRASVATSYAH